jgi:hypothetical protein
MIRRQGGRFQTVAQNCCRCGKSATARWIAGSRPALLAKNHFDLCPSCIELLVEFLRPKSGEPRGSADTTPGQDDSSRPAWTVGLEPRVAGSRD